MRPEPEPSTRCDKGMTELLIRAVDYHTAGEPFRILTDPLELRGRTVAERRQHAIDDLEVNRLRQLLCYEPRGHADMYGGFITPPDDDGAHFGVLFWHKDGFSTACGHGTIALGVWAVQTGRVELSAPGTADVVIDVPSGRVLARVHSDGQRITDVDFVNVPSYATASDVDVATSQGAVSVTLAFGGAFYAIVDAALLGLRVTQEHLPSLIALGREIRGRLDDSPHVQHSSDPRLSGVYGTIFYEDLGPSPDGNLLQRNVTIFADGEVDRSPCGSGTCARLAALHAAGGITIGQVLTHESIVGSRFQARVLDTVLVDHHPAVIPQVTGVAHKTGEHTFIVDPDDDLTPGFVLR
jgi:proline racemase